MQVTTQRLILHTKGTGDLINITERIEAVLKSSGAKKGSLTVFVIGSTAAITTFEYEPGLIEDIQGLYDKLVPKNKHYLHDETWGDANGFSHLRAAIQGPSLTVPFDNAELFLGTWQQVVLAEFDTRPRQRQVIVQIIGE